MALVAGLAILLWQLAALLLLVFGSILIAIFLGMLTDRIAGLTGLSRGWSLLVVAALLIAAVCAGTYFGGQALAEQVSELTDRVPRSLEQIRQRALQYEWGQWFVERVPTSAEDVEVSNQDLAAYASGALSSVSGALGGIVVVAFLALYLAYQPQPYVAGFLRLVPANRRSRVADILEEVHLTLKRWLLGMIVSMFLVGTLTALGLSIIGVEPAMALGSIAALLTFVPNFGPIIAAVPAVLLAFVESPMTALYVVGLYLAIQTVESYLITPLIQQEAADVPPALTIVAQVGMGVLLGVAGVVLATPLMVAALVVIQRLYVEDFIEQQGR